jgi:hypothetical protein
MHLVCSAKRLQQRFARQGVCLFPTTCMQLRHCTETQLSIQPMTKLQAMHQHLPAARSSQWLDRAALVSMGVAIAEHSLLGTTKEHWGNHNEEEVTQFADDEADRR